MASTQTNQSLLVAWNSELVDWLVPHTVVLIIYIIIGIAGNSFVIYIDTWRLTSKKEDRYFIPILAAVDMATCVLNTSCGVVLNNYPVMFTDDFACKFIHFVCMMSTVASILMLVLIAIQRYQKICKPFDRQMTLFWKRFAVFIVILVSLMSSWPCFLFYGAKEIESIKYNTVGLRCTSINGAKSKTAEYLFKGYIVLFIAITTTSLIILYTLIRIAIYRHTKIQNLKLSKCPPKAASRTKTINDAPPSKQIHARGTKCDVTDKNKPGDDSMPSDNKTKIPGTRLSLIFMVITILFIITFIPKVILMVFQEKHDFWTRLSQTELTGFRFLYSAFIINNIVNPFIYGFMDRRFRKEVQETWYCVMKEVF